MDYCIFMKGTAISCVAVSSNQRKREHFCLDLGIRLFFLLQYTGTCTLCLKQTTNVRPHWLASSSLIFSQRCQTCHEILLLRVFLSELFIVDVTNTLKMHQSVCFTFSLFSIRLSLYSDQFHKAGRPELS